VIISGSDPGKWFDLGELLISSSLTTTTTETPDAILVVLLIVPLVDLKEEECEHDTYETHG